MVILLEILNATQPNLIPKNEAAEDESWDKQERPMGILDRRRPGAFEALLSPTPLLSVSPVVNEGNGVCLQVVSVRSVYNPSYMPYDTLRGLPSPFIPSGGKTDKDTIKMKFLNRDTNVTGNNNMVSSERSRIPHKRKLPDIPSSATYMEDDNKVVLVEMHKNSVGIKLSKKSTHVHKLPVDNSLQPHKMDPLCKHCQTVVEALPRSLSSENIGSNGPTKASNRMSEGKKSRRSTDRPLSVGQSNRAYQHDMDSKV
jgi:hypothetical protein